MEPEGSTLEFKRELKIYEGEGKTSQRHELIKDILAMANGSRSSVPDTKYIVYGVADELSVGSGREVVGIEGRFPTRDDLLKMVNEVCDPDLSDIDVTALDYQGKKVYVIEISPTREVLETIKELGVPDGKRGRKTFSPRTIFKRRGEEVLIASLNDAITLRIAKQKYFDRLTTPPTRRVGQLVGGTVGYLAGLRWSWFVFDESSHPAWRFVFALLLGFVLSWLGWSVALAYSEMYDVSFKWSRLRWWGKVIVALIVAGLLSILLLSTYIELLR